MELLNTYVRAVFPEARETELEALAMHLQERLIPICKDFSSKIGASGETELRFHFEQGSLINRNQIFGALIATYVAVSQYHDFREGVIQLYEDVHSAGSFIVDEFKHVIGRKDDDLMYRRIGSRDVNRLKRIVQNVDGLLEAPKIHPQGRIDEIVSDLAGFVRSNRSEPGLRRLLNIIPDEIPEVPREPEALFDLDRRRRFSDGEAPFGQIPFEGTSQHRRLPPPSYARRRTRPYRYDSTIPL